MNSTLKIQLSPIGMIHTPYLDASDIPIQGIFKTHVIGRIELNPEFAPGVNDLHDFRNAILLYFFHRTEKVHPVKIFYNA
ncbi:hypothetical protein JXJ21_15545 [candidate division KSB1 bacterium]|nr:hypothetical protein [candidate division KSB1 bacterium]